MPTESTLDLLTMGRSSIDLYANDVGAPFPDIKSFAAYVGGSPTNIAVGARRLGLSAAVLTALGDDPVADFILKFLKAEGVETAYIPSKPGTRTSAVVDMPSEWPSPITALMMARLSPRRSRSRMNERSILILSNGNERR